MYDNLKGKFIVVEGLDGAGKSTQHKLLIKYFEERNVKLKHIHFPRMESTIYGEMVSSFLRGDYGKVEDIDPHLVALIFACNRNESKTYVQEFLDKEYLLLVDRYVYSNIAFQCAKVESIQDKERLSEWIMKLEFEHNRIPRPDLSIFIKMPFGFIEEQLNKSREGEDREYLKGKTDIHEDNLSLQKRVEEEYLRHINGKDFFSIDCVNLDKNLLRTPEMINKDIIQIIESFFL